MIERKDRRKFPNADRRLPLRAWKGGRRSYEKLNLSESPLRSLVGHVLARGNMWTFWWPDGMKMSGFIGNGVDGRIVEVVK